MIGFRHTLIGQSKGANPFTNPSLYNPEWWFDGADPDGNGIKPVIDTFVSTWVNKGSGNNGVVNVDGNTPDDNPLYKGDSIFFPNQGVTVNPFYTVVLDSNISQPFTIIYTTSFDIENTNMEIVASTNNASFRSFSRKNSINNYVIWSDSFLSDATSFATGEKVITQSVFNGANSKIRNNNTVYDEGNIGNNGLSSFTIGASNLGTPSNFFAGNYYSLFIKQGVMSDTDIEEVANWMKFEYDVQFKN